MSKYGRKLIRVESCPNCGKWQFVRVKGASVIDNILECPVCTLNIGVPKEIGSPIRVVLVQFGDEPPKPYMGDTFWEVDRLALAFVT